MDQGWQCFAGEQKISELVLNSNTRMHARILVQRDLQKKKLGWSFVVKQCTYSDPHNFPVGIKAGR